MSDDSTSVGPAEGAPLPNRLAFAFFPLHKRAFGVAIGLAFGLVMAGATVVVLLRDAASGPLDLGLLRAYFWGYTVSWPGVIVGFAWAFVAGFTAGWFVAFCRNMVLAISIFLVRTRAELFETRDFLDHI